MTQKKFDPEAMIHSKNNPKHGLYSWIDSKRLPRGRAFQRTRHELGHLRAELVAAHGGEGKIGPEALILVDSIIEGLGVQKLLGLYVRTCGVLDQPSAKQGRLELTPILGKGWIGYAHVVRQGILALREIEKGKKAEEPDIVAWAEEFDREKAAEAAKDAPASPDAAQGGAQAAQGGRSEAGEAGATGMEAQDGRHRPKDDPDAELTDVEVEAEIEKLERELAELKGKA